MLNLVVIPDKNDSISKIIDESVRLARHLNINISFAVFNYDGINNIVYHMKDLLNEYFNITGLKSKDIILIISCNEMNRILLSEDFRTDMKYFGNTNLNPEESIRIYFGFKEVKKI
jgi:hypothetical protein